MARFVTLRSGSSGNCTAISDGDTTIIIDMGSSCRSIVAAMRAVGIDPTAVSAIFVTHEHSDHIAGLLTFLKYYPAPLYSSPPVLGYLRKNSHIPRDAELGVIEPGQTVQVGTLRVRAFQNTHDSLDCLGFRVDLDEQRSIAVATDLGYISDDVLEVLSGCKLVALESNYDEHLLEIGGYPRYLKNRIRSMDGHLCNSECAVTAAMLAQCGTSCVVLMHLSEENNTPETALTTVLSCFEDHGIGPELCRVVVAPRHGTSEVIEV